MNQIIDCCFLSKRKYCTNEAEFEINENTRVDPDNATYCCGKHLYKLLGTTVGYPECNSWTITRIGAGLSKEDRKQLVLETRPW